MSDPAPDRPPDGLPEAIADARPSTKLVYQQLHAEGPLPAATLTDQLSLGRSTVYDALAELEGANLLVDCGRDIDHAGRSLYDVAAEAADQD